MKLLKDLLYKSGLTEVHGATDVSVDEVCFDSRKAKPGALFVAVRGTMSDGHRFIPDVISKGCRYIYTHLPRLIGAGSTSFLKAVARK